MSQPAPARIGLAARLLATLISAVVGALGVLAIATQHYYGRTNKFGGAEVIADGRQAIVMGIGLIVLGLFPLALWARTGRQAAIWASVCASVGIALMVGASRVAA